MMLTFPIRCHSGLRPTITQHYGEVGNLEWYRSKGIEIPRHNGTDIIIGDPKQTYGSALIVPGDGWRMVKETFDEPLSTKGNGVTIQSPSFIEDGMEKVLQAVYWHCSEVVQAHGELSAGTVVGYVGNSGAVRPEPSPACPYCGSHLHLMLFEFRRVGSKWVKWYTDNGLDGAIDPMSRFSLDNLEHGQDSDVSKDNPPLVWAMGKIGLDSAWQKIVYLYKLFIK